MSRFFVEASGGEAALDQVHPNIEAAITAFMRFTNAALDEWFHRAQQDRGAKFFDFGDGALPRPAEQMEGSTGDQPRNALAPNDPEAAQT
ncbi:MAG: hypothetical protein ABI948_11510 [Thermoleophilia bacterium]